MRIVLASQEVLKSSSLKGIYHLHQLCVDHFHQKINQVPGLSDHEARKLWRVDTYTQVLPKCHQ